MNFGEDKRTINTSKNILDYKAALDYSTMMQYINVFAERYPFMAISSLGESIMGRSIPIITLGRGERSVIYVGAHHAMEWITSVILLRFINEYCELKKKHSMIFGRSVDYLFATRTIYVIPMLNPDGIEYQINGVGEENPLYDRLLRMNGGSLDFSFWQANARGVDLNHNYDFGFEEYKRLEERSEIYDGAPTRFSGCMPESEPETASLCNFIRFREEEIMGILTLHTQGEEIYYREGKKRSFNATAKLLSRISGYKLSKAEGMAAYGGLSDWFSYAFGRPSFTIECGKGENPLPLSDYFKIYTRIREMLFCAPNFL